MVSLLMTWMDVKVSFSNLSFFLKSILFSYQVCGELLSLCVLKNCFPVLWNYPGIILQCNIFPGFCEFSSHIAFICCVSFVSLFKKENPEVCTETFWLKLKLPCLTDNFKVKLMEYCYQGTQMPCLFVTRNFRD